MADAQEEPLSQAAGVFTAFLVSLRACSLVDRLLAGRNPETMKTVKVLFVCMGSMQN